MDGCPLGLGLVVEDKPTEFSCTLSGICILVLILKVINIVHIQTAYCFDLGTLFCGCGHGVPSQC